VEVYDKTRRQFLEEIRVLPSKNAELECNSRRISDQKSEEKESRTDQVSQENEELCTTVRNKISEPKIRHKQKDYIRNTYRMLVIGVGLTAFFWILESVIHAFVFHDGSFLDQILPLNYHELLMRLSICFFLIWFSVYAQIIVKKLGQAKVDLQQSHNKLEIRIRERTAELEKTNKKLLTEINERKKADEKLIEYQQQLRYLASELTRAEEETRRRIAVELHDKIGHNLALAKIKTESLSDQLDIKSSGQTDEIIDILAKSMRDISSFIFELSPAVLYELGLDAAIEWLAKDFEEKSGIYCRFSGDGHSHLLSKELQVLLFRSVRELLVNIRKHANAKRITIISGENSSGYHITVEDDGVGFEPSSISMLNRSSSGGFGLFSIIERLDYQGGSCEINSKPQEGTKITLFIPKNKMRCNDDVKDNCGR
jgi:signal transduction histidine kinase